MGFTLLILSILISVFFLAVSILQQMVGRSGEPVKAYVSPDGAQRVHVEVRNGYHPHVIHARSGRPLNLYFYRIEDQPCSEEIVLEDFGVRQMLPPYKTTRVEIVPFQPGEYEFGCGHHVLQGKLIVQ